MQPDTLLTQDEIDFIQSMHHSLPLDSADVSAGLMVNGGSQLQALLTRLVAHEHVTIQAQYENQQLSFPLQLVEDEFHAQHIKMGAPTIYEDGPMVRPWRLALPSPVPLQDRNGMLTHLKLVEVSVNGVVVQVRAGVEAPEVFSLWFAPEGYTPIALRGSLERQIADGFMAYRLIAHAPHETERLRHYILEQHRLAHPGLHSTSGVEVPGDVLE
ncbi:MULTISPECIES: hypothetical protein [Pseudomonas]|uniref:PilZ domain-containing protein n=1 Tax=Pseudomonas quercus TaxID=2722792 RepID=A0ABX0YC09_9PSED|nr:MULTISPECIES: hypothetical protein [Pseudomonas]MBF7141884.1 hypothetical protein [Pseudomonas sp. LY10J]NJP00422.1 hypothetical protein [Pseudomonas quercus]